MKNLPDKFPIRYAIIVKSDEEIDDIDLSNKFKNDEILFREFLVLLQQKPLSKDMLSMSETFVNFSLFGVRIIDLVRLEGDFEWIELAKNKIKDILPNIECEGWGSGLAFTLGLYSYNGNYEIPAFVRAYNYREDSRDHFHNKFGYSISESKVRFFFQLSKDVSEGKIKDWELYKSLNEYERPIYINSYYSNIWKMLDQEKLDGMIKPDHVVQNLKIKEIAKLDEKKKYRQKIQIAVCKSWESLFAEEILSIYKMFRFCNNCGKPLPFNYQGKYCPETKRNRECVRERARKRARKNSQDF